MVIAARAAGSTVADFDRPAYHGFVRVAACIPKVALANPAANVADITRLALEAGRQNTRVIAFPELSLSGYSNDDLFFQDALLDAVEDGPFRLLVDTAELSSVMVEGAPLRVDSAIFNCAVVMLQGKVLAVVPKTYLPNYREFYEKRYFASGLAARSNTFQFRGAPAPFGNDILLSAPAIEGLTLHVEICEDLWVPIPPSTHAALGGATLLINLSASNATIAKSQYRKLLAASQSARCISGYLYCAAGYGESTTDLAWDGHALIYENGELVAERQRFTYKPSVTVADLDLDRLRQERCRMTSFTDCAQACRSDSLRVISMEIYPVQAAGRLARPLPRYPFVPVDPATLSERCAEIIAIQAQGLVRRLEATGLRKVVLGISGGADSALALLVAVHAFDAVGYPREGILCFELPGFATSPVIQINAKALISALGATEADIDIRPSATQMLRDIGHPYALGEPLYDKTFENVQAGERASHLFRLANLHNALVVGTSDLSELAMGYTTYGVGDQMSHYAVNASVPKTLIRSLLSWFIRTGALGRGASAALERILQTPATPELVPSGAGNWQMAEEAVGPYALVDFFLYYMTRFGYRPSKVAYLAAQAWADPGFGDWPADIAQTERVAYSAQEIHHWFGVFLKRFFAESQFKRSALPNGPKIGSGGNLSPRGDWRAPSDNNADVWLGELSRSQKEVPT